eukprot:796382-Amphidinium_carterae.2
MRIFQECVHLFHDLVLLRFDEKLEFNAGDVGVAGGVTWHMHLRQCALENSTPRNMSCNLA